MTDFEETIREGAKKVRERSDRVAAGKAMPAYTTHRVKARMGPSFWRHPFVWLAWRRWERWERKMKKENPQAARAVDQLRRDVESQVLFGERKDD